MAIYKDVFHPRTLVNMVNKRLRGENNIFKTYYYEKNLIIRL